MNSKKILSLVAVSALLLTSSVFADKVWKTGAPTIKLQNTLKSTIVFMDINYLRSRKGPDSSGSERAYSEGLPGDIIATVINGSFGSKSSVETTTTFHAFKIYDAKTKKTLPNCDMMQNSKFNPNSNAINIQLSDRGCVVT